MKLKQFTRKGKTHIRPIIDTYGTKITIGHKCLKCKKIFKGHKEKPPVRCPYCYSDLWNVPENWKELI